MTDADIAGNAKDFRSEAQELVTKNYSEISTSSAKKIDDAYARLTSLQAWRSYVLDESLSPGAMGFFAEAQNDGLTSNILVSCGLWRSSMMSHRSLIENIMHSIFYIDHPVEYRKWESGHYKQSFSKLFDYFSEHPDISDIHTNINPIPSLRGIYSKLSNVVHASGKNFRMTSDIHQPNLWKTSASDIGQWSAMQKSILRDVNLLLIAVFRSKLQGAARKGLREAVSLAIPASKDSSIKNELGVRILR